MKQSKCSCSEPNNRTKLSQPEVLTGKFYWFEWKDSVFLLRIYNSFRFEEDPFLFVMLVPTANKKTWPDFSCSQTLADAFNKLQTLSSFIPLYREKKKQIEFEANLNVGNKVLSLQLKLTTSSLFVLSPSPVVEFTSCVSFLDHVHLGTKSWTRLYKDQDKLYVLFVEVFCVTYPKSGEDLNGVSVFRVGDVNELFFATLWVETEKGKVSLTGMESFRKIQVVKKCSKTPENEHVFKLGHKSTDYVLLFSSEEKFVQQFRVFIAGRKLEEETALPALEKLSQIGRKTFGFTDNSYEKLMIEVPCYSFGQKLESSKVVIAFRIFAQRHKKSSELRVYSDVFNLEKKENVFTFDVAEDTFNVYIEYKVENKKLVFGVSKVVKLSHMERVVEQEETRITEQMWGKKSDLSCVSGAVVYTPTSTSVLTNPEPKIDKEPNLPELKLRSEKDSKQTEKYKVICVISALLLVIGCFVAFQFYFSFRRKRFKKRRTKRKTKSN